MIFTQRVCHYLLFLTFLVGISMTPVLGQQRELTGRVIDSDTQKPVEYANVSVWTNDSVLVTGGLTDSAGQFAIKGAFKENAFVKVQFLGYQTSVQKPLPESPDKSFKFMTVYLKMTGEALKEVVVKGEKSASSVQIDKQVFRANQFQNAANGTGLDLLQRLPSITANTEGDIALRGNTNFIVLINGKPSTRTPAEVLTQLAANTIESIEVITSPSARYDADGKSGIINIITKKDATLGWSLAGNGMAGGLKPPRAGADLTVNYNAKTWTAYVAGDYRRFDFNGYRVGEVRSLYGDTLTYLPSEGVRNYRDYQYSFRAGGSYTPNAANTLTAGVYLGEKQTDRTADLHYREYIQTGNNLDLYSNRFGQPISEFFNQNLFVRSGRFQTANVDFTHLFPNKSKLTLLGLHEYSVLGGPLNNYDTVEGTSTPRLHERSDEVSPLTGWRGQADYTLPLPKNHRLEMGYQLRSLRHEGVFTFERRDLQTGIWLKDPAFSDRMDLQQQIHGGYVQLGGEKKKFSYNLGLRAEYMDRTLTHDLGEQPFTYRKSNLFPSAQGLWSLSNSRKIRLAYTRRIDRPTTKLMAPFKNHRHAETIELGDPNLRPEIADVVEASYNKAWSNVDLTVTGYYNHTTDKVFRVNEVYTRTILLRTYTNAGQATSLGTEFSASIKATPFWRFYASGNVYQFTVKGAFNGLSTNQQSINYNTSANTTIDISPRLRFQYDMNYLSRTVTSQGIDSDLLLANAGLRYTIWNNRGTLALQLQNVFNSNIQTIMNRAATFYSTTDYRKYDRILQVSLGFRLNDSGRKAKALKTEFGEKEF